MPKPKLKPEKSAPAVIDPEEALARLCADAALDKKAENVVILDMRAISSFTDFFVIVSGTSDPQLKRCHRSEADCRGWIPRKSVGDH